MRLQYLDGLTGSLLGSYELSGNHTSAGGNGYDQFGTASVAIGHGNWYVVAEQCYVANSCINSTAKLYAVKVPGLQMDYPRGAILTAGESWKYFAVLGDSFSSGEGAGNYNPATNVPANQNGFNECHRSTNAYYHHLDGTLGLHLNGGGFIACSGAQTPEIVDTYQYDNQPAQAPLLSRSADYVMLTVGGNDVGFGSFAAACFWGSCTGTPYASILSAISSELPAKLANAYGAIHDHVGSQTHVLVLGYPMIVPEPNQQLSSCGSLDTNEMNAARDVVSHLNNAIQTAVETEDETSGVNGPRFEFVSVTGQSSPFSGHELCTDDSYFNSIEPLSGSISAIAAESYHPNAKGQEAYAFSVEMYLAS
jgi:hypothetical protein